MYAPEYLARRHEATANVAAANAALAIFRDEATYPQLHRLGNYLRDGVRRVLADFGQVATVLGDGPLAQIAFTSTEARDFRSSQHQDPQLARRLMLELFSRLAVAVFCVVVGFIVALARFYPVERPQEARIVVIYGVAGAVAAKRSNSGMTRSGLAAKVSGISACKAAPSPSREISSSSIKIVPSFWMKR